MLLLVQTAAQHPRHQMKGSILFEEYIDLYTYYYKLAAPQE